MVDHRARGAVQGLQYRVKPSNRISQAGYTAKAWAENNCAHAQSVFRGHADMNADWGNGPLFRLSFRLDAPRDLVITVHRTPRTVETAVAAWRGPSKAL